MTRRTVTDAERELEALAPGLNPVSYRDLAAEVSSARTDAESFANGMITNLAGEIEEARSAVLEDLCEIRDGFDALTREGQAGRIGAEEFHRQWDALAQRQRAAERTVARLAERAESVAAIEENPIAYADRFYTSTPNLMPEFSF